MKRNKVLEAINDLPPEFDLDELIERLVLMEKVEEGMEHLKEGKTKSHDEVKRIVKSWQK